MLISQTIQAKLKQGLLKQQLSYNISLKKTLNGYIWILQVLVLWPLKVLVMELDYWFNMREIMHLNDL